MLCFTRAAPKVLGPKHVYSLASLLCSPQQFNVRSSRCSKLVDGAQPPVVLEANWLQRLEKKPQWLKSMFTPVVLAMAHPGLQTVTHRDSCGVWTWMKHAAGTALWCVWGLEDGAMLKEKDELTFQPAKWWQLFFSLPSSQLVIIEQGDFVSNQR